MVKIRVLDLFSGIGGFGLGLERVGGFETVAFCEIGDFPRSILSKHWPKVPCYDDVRTLTAARLAADGISVDAICGGFPCQDISDAGAREGIGGSRSGLWTEFARLIGELRPNYVIVENVSALLDRGLGDVLGDLAALGYDAEWHCIPASALGAPHVRDRIWIVAFPNAPGRRGLFIGWKQLEESRHQARHLDLWPVEPPVPRVADGVPNRMDLISGLGNSVVPQIVEMIGRAIVESEWTGGRAA